MLIDLIVGARPNFMKIASLIVSLQAAMEKKAVLKYRLIHTGQHYDTKMSGQFFEELGIPEPDINLNAGGGLSQSEQTARIMVAYEALLTDSPCDLCIVVGDVNSTMACTLTAKKKNIKVAHIEAGIRSGDRSMPEEINRIVTDSISDYFFTTTLNASQNLKNSGVDEKCIFWVGNTMIDTLLRKRQYFAKPAFWDEYQLARGEYVMLTLHRPSNVDDQAVLSRTINKILESTRRLPVVFPVHPRTRQKLNQIAVTDSRLICTEPLGYLEFNYMVENSMAVITDSGGITEETTVLGVPCMTLRDSTERPETVTIGTNELVGSDPDNIPGYMEKLFSGKWKNGGIPEKWDGMASERIVGVIVEQLMPSIIVS